MSFPRRRICQLFSSVAVSWRQFSLARLRMSREKFNRSSGSPKLEGKVKPFYKWTLSEFINVAHEVGLVKLDVQKFSHGLRDFRNYIHPYEQIASGFRPTNTRPRFASKCSKAALADVAGDR